MSDRLSIKLSSNVIAPAEHVQQARQISATHQNNTGCFDDRPEMMLPTALSPSGKIPATHFLCSRVIPGDAVDKIQITLTGRHEPWVSGEVYSLKHDAKDILTKFCQVIGDKDAFLKHLGLKVIE